MVFCFYCLWGWFRYEVVDGMMFSFLIEVVATLFVENFTDMCITSNLNLNSRLSSRPSRRSSGWVYLYASKQMSRLKGGLVKIICKYANLERQNSTISKPLYRIRCAFRECFCNSFQLFLLFLCSYPVRSAIVIHNFFHKGDLLHRFFNDFLGK